MQEKHLRYKYITKPPLHLDTPTFDWLTKSSSNQREAVCAALNSWSNNTRKTCSEINRAFDLSVIMRTTLFSKNTHIHTQRSAHTQKYTKYTTCAPKNTHTENLFKGKQRNKQRREGNPSSPPGILLFCTSRLLSSLSSHNPLCWE